jgi:hypothetical protein
MNQECCLNGVRILECLGLPDGNYRCFHSEYYLGDDVLPDTLARPATTTATAPPPSVTPPVRFPDGVKSNATIDRDLGEPIAEFANRQRNGAFPQDPLDKDRSGHAAADSRSFDDQAWFGFCGHAAVLYAVLSNSNRRKD